jgi:hypothetical protein
MSARPIASGCRGPGIGAAGHTDEELRGGNPYKEIRFVKAPRLWWFAGSVLLVMSMVWSAAAIASEKVIGSVLAVRGDVFSDSGKGLQRLIVKAPVHRGEAIVAANGKAQIALSTGTVISVGEHSRMQIDDYDDARDQVGTRIKLIAGALRLLVAKLAPSGSFEVETETAIAAVRGTDWVIEATTVQTSVVLVSGVVAVSGRQARASEAVVLDTSGDGTDVRPGDPPTPAKQWSAKRFADTVARASFD